ncbi:MAG: GDSL-type esterase/lipase family protein [Flavisolibacter sp.]
MKRTLRILFFTISFLALRSTVCAQPFIDEIRTFRHQDSVHTPPKNANLFVGSSSLRMWTDIQDYFPGYKIINRGFGGSSLPDVIRYVPDIIYAYHPSQILIYCGENDLAASDTVTATTVAARFRELFKMIRTKWPSMPVVFISIKPSPSREKLMPKMVEANRLIRNFLRTQKNTRYVDVYTLMLTKDGKLRPELYREDKLHMNAMGYAIWKKALLPVMKK